MANIWGTLKKSFMAKKNSPVEVANPDLFSPLKMDGIGEVKSRMVLAPMTRARTTTEGVVGKHHVDYYTQRATGGNLVITEGVFVSPSAIGWWCAPNFFTEEQIRAWKPVTDSVHSVGGKIVLQLGHMGRVGHSDYQPNKDPPPAPSAIAISNGEGVHVPGGGKKEHEVPRAVTTEEVGEIIKDFVQAAKNALSVGFDGVEIHGCNGLLIDEFIQSISNKRTDKYGGSIENRVRIVDEMITKMVAEGIPANKIGIRYSPNGAHQDMGSEDNVETFDAAIEVAAKHKIAYVHVVDGLAFGFHQKAPQYTLAMASEVVKKVQPKQRVTMIMGNCGHTKETGMEAIKNKEGDLISYGRPWIANPDLVERFKHDWPLTEVEGMGHFYTANTADPSKGYSDFKVYEKAVEK